ncbi:Arm DNA-binding domain-containing protein [Bacillus inaquosorum]|uniref:Arm DNA-binding domain-containing protein n=1 Tax=Bacillus inaquosorum TaxID=483913 RepID=UPI003D1E02A1
MKPDGLMTFVNSDGLVSLIAKAGEDKTTNKQMAHKADAKDDKTGTYYFVYSGGTHRITKKRIQRKRKGIKTYKEAQEVLKQVILEVEEEKNYLPEISESFGTYAESWLESKRVKLRPSTFNNYREILQYNVLP